MKRAAASPSVPAAFSGRAAFAGSAAGLAVCWVLAGSLPAGAQEKKDPPAAGAPAPASGKAEEHPAHGEETRAEGDGHGAESGGTTVSPREEELVKTLANVEFQGRWCAIEKGVMGEPRPEQYQIVGIVKTGGDRWMINARIEYGKVNLVAPVPVQVKWAGDTPVIVVDKFTLPGGGTYSARVMVYEGTYSGTWTAGDHGGLLHGVIVRKP